MLKTLFVGISMFGFSLCANAQFRVHSNGNIAFHTTETPLSPVSLNCSGHANYFVRYEGEQSGLYCSTTNQSNTAIFYLTPSKTTNYTLRSQVVAPDSLSTVGTFAIGAWGCGGHSLKNYGVVGTIVKKDGTYGTGIYGADNPLWISTFDRNYAGFFEGDVKVTKDLQVDGSIQGVVLGTSATAASSAHSEQTLPAQLKSATAATSAAVLLSQLDMSTYRHTPSVKRMAMNTADHAALFADSSIDESMIAEAMESLHPSYIQEQNLKKTHYALDADQLEAIFPDLVYEEEDGTKVINYMEMIPLLVKTIGELNARISELEGTGNGSVMQSRANLWNGDDTEQQVPALTAKVSKLFQNTPNPFTESTRIRFSLPEDVQNAYIYIFDMSGKMLRQVPVDASMQSITINGYELSAGIYLYSLVVNGQEMDTKRMIITK